MKSLSHTAKLRIALLMAMALLAAQFVAQAHAYSHLRAPPHAASPLEHHSNPCADCLAFAPLLASAGGPDHALLLPLQGVHTAPDAAVKTLTTATATHAFRSRAPPSIH